MAVPSPSPQRNRSYSTITPLEPTYVDVGTPQQFISAVLEEESVDNPSLLPPSNQQAFRRKPPKQPTKTVPAPKRRKP